MLFVDSDWEVSSEILMFCFGLAFGEKQFFILITRTRTNRFYKKERSKWFCVSENRLLKKGRNLFRT